MTGPTGAPRLFPSVNRIQMNQIIMKKLLTTLAIVGMALSVQAQVSLADKIAEAETGWLIGTWTAEMDSYTLTLTYKWALKDRVISSHLKTGDSESFGLIGVNPDSGEIEQISYDSKGRKSEGTWGPKGDMPMLKTESKSDSGESRRMAVAFRKIDENNIEAQIFEVDAAGAVGDFSSFSFEMKRKKEKKE